MVGRPDGPVWGPLARLMPEFVLRENPGYSLLPHPLSPSPLCGEGETGGEVSIYLLPRRVAAVGLWCRTASVEIGNQVDYVTDVDYIVAVGVSNAVGRLR
jgi:hypothetical protein